jgi:hypothetical protein
MSTGADKLKNEAAVRRKLKQVKFRHLQKLLKRHFSSEPIVCPSCHHEFRLKSKADIKKEFDELMKQDRAVIASEFPDITALLWVLDEECSPKSSVDDDIESVIVDLERQLSDLRDLKDNGQPSKKGWWSRFVDSLSGGGGE